MCFSSLYIAAILWNYIQDSLGSLCLSHHNYTLMVGKVRCLVYLAEILVGCLGSSVMKVDLAGALNKKWVTSGFRLKVMLGGYLCV